MAGRLGALIVVLGLAPGRPLPHVAIAGSCAGSFPSLAAQTLFAGTVYQDRGYTLSVEPVAGHPSVWQFGLLLPPVGKEHVGDAYYGYAHAEVGPAGTRLCSSAQATYLPANLYATHYPRSVELRLDGIVDVAHLTARVTIAVAGRTIMIDEGNPSVPTTAASSASRTMDRLIATLNGRRWADVYALLAPQARQQIDEKTYARPFDHFFVSIATDGRGVLRSGLANDAIITAFGARAGYVQQVRVRLRRADGRIYDHHRVVELVLIRGTWYLGATDDWTH